MRITKLICRANQTCLVDDETSETVALFAVEHEGETGFVKLNCFEADREADTELFASSEALAAAARRASEKTALFYEALYATTPESTSLDDHADVLASCEHEAGF